MLIQNLETVLPQTDIRYQGYGVDQYVHKPMQSGNFRCYDGGGEIEFDINFRSGGYRFDPANEYDIEIKIVQKVKPQITTTVFK